MEATTTYCRPCDVHHDSHGIFRSLSPECPLAEYLPNDFEERPMRTSVSDELLDRLVYGAATGMMLGILLVLIASAL